MCARGACSTWSSGPSTSPLDAVKGSAYVALLAVLSASASAQQAAALPRDLLGRWTLVGEPVPGCTSASLEFTADGHLKITSGAQILEATVRVTAAGDGFTISTHLLRHNDEPNCQGRTAAYVAEHFAPYMFVRVMGAKLNAVILDQNGRQHGPNAEFRRDDGV